MVFILSSLLLFLSLRDPQETVGNSVFGEITQLRWKQGRETKEETRERVKGRKKEDRPKVRGGKGRVGRVRDRER